MTCAAFKIELHSTVSNAIVRLSGKNEKRKMLFCCNRVIIDLVVIDYSLKTVCVL